MATAKSELLKANLVVREANYVEDHRNGEQEAREKREGYGNRHPVAENLQWLAEIRQVWVMDPCPVQACHTWCCWSCAHRHVCKYLQQNIGLICTQRSILVYFMAICVRQLDESRFYEYLVCPRNLDLSDRLTKVFEICKYLVSSKNEPCMVSRRNERWFTKHPRDVDEQLEQGMNGNSCRYTNKIPIHTVPQTLL